MYDRVNKWGGAERVLLALHEIFPKAPLYTSVYDQQKAPWAKVFKVKTSFLQKFPFAKAHHEFYAVFMPLAFESFNFDKYDLVISVTSESSKGIITRSNTRHISYILTPTRYLWSGYDEYFKNIFLRIVSWPIVVYLRNWDKIASQRPDTLIAISEEVKKRIKKYYDTDAQVIYPPLGISPTDYGLRHSRKAVVGSRPTESYFLIVSRLVPYKKIDLAIKVFNKLKLSLKIVGRGSEEERLREMAKENIEFLGHLTDLELVKYYKECRALVFPGKEDFGLTIIEAQGFGKPVIAYSQGGALETIIDGQTGIFFENQTQKSLEQAINKFKRKKFDPSDCIKQARRFSMEVFKKKVEKEISQITKN